MPYVIGIGGGIAVAAAVAAVLLTIGINTSALSSAQHQPEAAPKIHQVSTADVLTVIAKHNTAFKQCVIEQKAAAPGASGKLVMRWTILPSGKASGVVPASGANEELPLAQCFARVIESLQFPSASKESEPILLPFSY